MSQNGMYEQCRVVYRCMCIPVQAGVRCGLDWYTGWVYRGSTTQPRCSGRGPGYSGAGPGSPTGAGVGGILELGRGWSCTHPGTARARSLRSLVQDRPFHRLWTNMARIDLIFLKVKQNGGVSPGSVQKACHSPYSQNEARNSPLEILRFLF